MKLITILILFLLYFNYIGIYVCDLFSKQLAWIKFKLPIGMITVFGLMQLIFFPLSYFHVSMKILSISYILLLIILFLLASLYFLYQFKKNKVNCFKDTIGGKVFPIFIIFIFVGIHVFLSYITNSLNVPSSDQSFYITLVENNVNANNINTIAPLTGNIENVHFLYNFQSYYLFLSFISQVFNIKSLLISGWFTPIFSMLFIATTLFNLFNYLKFNFEKKIGIIGFFILTFMFNFWPIETLVKYNMMGVNFRNYIFIYILIVYYEMFRKNRIDLSFYNMLWLAVIAVQSTSLFNGYILLASLILYDIFIKKDKLLFELLNSSFGLHIYLLFFSLYSGKKIICVGLLILLLIYYVINVIPKFKPFILNLIYHDNFKKCIILLYVAVIILFQFIVNYKFLTPPITSDYFIAYLNEYYFNNSYYSFTIFSLISSFLKLFLIGINIYSIINYKKFPEKYRFFIYLQIILIIVFYNPLVAPFVSYFITGSVYFRVRDIIFNMPLMVVCLLYLKDNGKLSIFILRTVIGLSVVLSIINIYEYLTYTPNQITDSSKYSYYHRLPKDTVDVGYFLESYIDNYYVDPEYRPLVYSTNRQINYLSHNYQMVYTIYEERQFKNIDVNMSLRLLDKYALELITTNPDSYGEYINDYPQLLKNHGVEFIVIDNDTSDKIKSQILRQGKLIYYNDTYSIYQIQW